MNHFFWVGLLVRVKELLGVDHGLDKRLLGLQSDVFNILLEPQIKFQVGLDEEKDQASVLVR